MVVPFTQKVGSFESFPKTFMKDFKKDEVASQGCYSSQALPVF